MAQIYISVDKVQASIDISIQPLRTGLAGVASGTFNQLFERIKLRKAMVLSVKAMILLGSIIITGLSAGLFLAWSVSVIPGTQRISSGAYLETMQHINRAILNPMFFIIFFGSAALLSVASIFKFQDGGLAFWLMLAASVLYIVGTVGVTGMGNVPLNNQLDLLNLNDLDAGAIQNFREFYEAKWNSFHLIRTVSCVTAFVLATLAVLSSSSN